MALGSDEKNMIIQQKIEAYERSYYDLSLELEISEEVGSEHLLKKTTEDMVKIKKAIKLLEKKLVETNKK